MWNAGDCPSSELEDSTTLRKLLLEQHCLTSPCSQCKENGKTDHINIRKCVFLCQTCAFGQPDVKRVLILEADKPSNADIEKFIGVLNSSSEASVMDLSPHPNQTLGEEIPEGSSTSRETGPQKKKKRSRPNKGLMPQQQTLQGWKFFRLKLAYVTTRADPTPKFNFANLKLYLEIDPSEGNIFIAWYGDARYSEQIYDPTMDLVRVPQPGATHPVTILEIGNKYYHLVLKNLSMTEYNNLHVLLGTIASHGLRRFV